MPFPDQHNSDHLLFLLACDSAEQCIQILKVQETNNPRHGTTLSKNRTITVKLRWHKDFGFADIQISCITHCRKMLRNTSDGRGLPDRTTCSSNASCWSPNVSSDSFHPEGGFKLGKRQRCDCWCTLMKWWHNVAIKCIGWLPAWSRQVIYTLYPCSRPAER